MKRRRENCIICSCTQNDVRLILIGTITEEQQEKLELLYLSNDLVCPRPMRRERLNLVNGVSNLLHFLPLAPVLSLHVAVHLCSTIFSFVHSI